MNMAAEALNGLIERQIFYPDPFVEVKPDAYGLKYQDMWFNASDGVRLHGWLVSAENPRGLVLFCHGNAGNISHRLDNIKRLHDRDLSVFIFDYREYGRSQGRITEKGLYLDAEAAYLLGRELAERENTRLVIFGRSLGGIVAVHMAAGGSCSGLILESTFTNLAAMAKQHFPIPMVHATLTDRFNAEGEIGRVKAPILFFHGDFDVIVPIDLGRGLYNAAPEPKEFVTLFGAGHNDTYLVAGNRYFDKLVSFIDGLPG